MIMMTWFVSELDLMKERFTKLLLGEDMSGGGKGVSSALALSNAITNLAGYSSLFFFPKFKSFMRIDITFCKGIGFSYHIKCVFDIP